MEGVRDLITDCIPDSPSAKIVCPIFWNIKFDIPNFRMCHGMAARAERLVVFGWYRITTTAALVRAARPRQLPCLNSKWGIFQYWKLPIWVF